MKGVSTAVKKAWKFVTGDQVMITRGRSKGRVARIAMVQRDGRTTARTGRKETKKQILRRKENPRVYLDGGVHQVRCQAVRRCSLGVIVLSYKSMYKTCLDAGQPNYERKPEEADRPAIAHFQHMSCGRTGWQEEGESSNESNR